MLSLIVKTSHAMIYVKDLDGRYRLANPVFQRAVGRSEEAILGRTDEEIEPPIPRRLASETSVITSHQDLCEQFELPTGTRYFDTMKFPLVDAAGVPYGVCSLGYDVTDSQAWAETMAQARDDAVAANVAKSSFLATMSQEVRTPTSAVIGMTDLLEQTNLDPEQQEMLQTVRSSGDALLAVINNILDFSKIEAGQLELETVDFVLQQELENCLDIVTPLATDKGIDVVCDVDDREFPVLCGDVARLRQIVINLLSNAVKFTQEGHVLLAVTCKGLGRDDVEVRLSVTDTGLGIPADGFSRLFESFSQVDASTTRVYGGSGLGLAISQRLAAAMGGQVEVDSSPGVGSTFTATVVLMRSAETPPASVPAPASTLEGRAVLVVDDSRARGDALAHQLTRLGMHCTTATSAADALAQVAEGLVYDVALIDLAMPGQEGFELGHALAEGGGVSAGAPLLLLTSLGSRPSGDEHLFADFVTKPVKSARLVEALVDVLSLDAGAKPPGETAPAVSGRALRILLAEDIALNQRVAQMMLHKLGHEVDVVDDGIGAVNAASVRAYDVVLMDIQMPHMDGLEAARTIVAQAPPGWLIDSYLDDSRLLVAKLAEAVAIGDALAVARAAHTLRSTSALSGASRLAGLLQQTGDAARTDPDELPELSTKVAMEHSHVCHSLGLHRSTAMMPAEAATRSG